jgi:pimeloyl-ACP methyl ester carboxylesterase
MPFFNLPPNDPTAALAYANLLNAVDFPGNRPQLGEAIRVIVGGNSFVIVESNSVYPTTWGYAIGGDCLLFFSSGIRSASSFSPLARSYTNPSQTAFEDGYLDYIVETVARIKQVMLDRGVRQMDKLVAVGHSMGGLIASEFCRAWPISGREISIDCCTFGMPKPTRSLARYCMVNRNARWSNTDDHVTRLPPLGDAAANLYSALTSRQRSILVSWIHTCQSLNLTLSGNITRSDTLIGPPVTISTLTAALQSNNGAFGPGHPISRYIELLTLAIPLYNVVPIPPPPVPPPGPLPVPALPPQQRVPAVPALPPPDAVMAANRVAFREFATNNDAIPADVPFPNKFQATLVDGIWYVTWMDYYVACGPTKKKCRALARHMNRFLPIFQGVGMCYSQGFVFALGEYLTAAADPNGTFSPKLNDGGMTPFVLVP